MEVHTEARQTLRFLRMTSILLADDGFTE